MTNKYYKRPIYWNKAIDYLKKNDPILKQILIKAKRDIFLTRNCTPFQTLINAILGQQISVKAATSVAKKLQEKTKKINPTNIYNASAQKLRGCGLSKQKIVYLKEISKKFLAAPRFFYNFKYLDDETIIQKLCMLKGIGEWTAQMYLIFQLNRPNVLPLGDLGFINSTTKLYKLSSKNNLKKITELSNNWIPYKTVAVWHIWRIIDADVVQY